MKFKKNAVNAAKLMRAAVTRSKGLFRGTKMTTKKVAKIAKRVVNAKAETKMVAFFEGPVGQPTPLQNSTGLYADQAYVAHNQFINNNATDILKVIPDVVQGTGDNNRDGRFINPVSGQLKIRVTIAAVQPQLGGWQNGINYDLTAVCYLLQSVTYKTYRSLYANNDFSKMFDKMDGTTTSFDGSYQCANLPIEKGYYRVLATKKVYLRSSGAATQLNLGTTGVNLVSNNNSAKLMHEWTWNYGKHLPKKLVYPESTEATTTGLNEPLNSSIFWCIGYYRTSGAVDAEGNPTININEEYTSIMKYKDF